MQTTCTVLFTAPRAAFEQHLLTLPWQQIIGARDIFANLPERRKQHIAHLCQECKPSAASLMAALVHLRHQR